MDGSWSGQSTVFCVLVGDRTLESCREFLSKLKSRLFGNPLFISDEFVHYQIVLKEFYSKDISLERTEKRGCPRNPGKELDPKLDYAVVHKTRQNGRVTKVEQRIIYGKNSSIMEKLSRSSSYKINTAYIERSNGRLRQMNSHLRRKRLTFVKEMPYLKAKLNIIVFHYNFIRPHSTLSKNLDKAITPSSINLIYRAI